MRQIHRRAFLSVVFPLLLGSGAAIADTLPTTGLGQSWPNASDVSASPHYHVYAFQKQGVRFVQVNDGDGTVRGAIAYGSELLQLPVGVDASRWFIAPDGGSAANSEQVYSDEAVTIGVAPQPDGTARLLVECKNPAECSVKGG